MTTRNNVLRKESRIKGLFSSKKPTADRRIEISPPTFRYQPGSSIATTNIQNSDLPIIPRLPSSPPPFADPNNRTTEFFSTQYKDNSRSSTQSHDPIPIPPYERPVSLTPTSHQSSFHDLILNFNSSPRTPGRNSSSRLELDLHSRDVHVEPEQVGPIQEVSPRSVVLLKSSTGDFGFSMNRCDPDEVPMHILEPRITSSTQNGLLSGDRLVEVNGLNVEQCSHNEVVDIIRRCGDSVELQVVAPPELYELAIRGALVPATGRAKKTSSAPHRRKSFHQRTVHSNFIGRMQKRTAMRMRETITEPSDTPGLHWLMHKAGYCGVIPVDDASSGSSTSLAGLGRYGDLKHSISGLMDGYRVKVTETGQVLSVDQDDVEPAQNIVNGIENLAELTYLNESNCLHVLRTRYSNSLVHTYAGRHLIVMNPIRELKCYSERVIEMFRGCQKDDMPPHIFAVAQTAYNEMRFSRQDQTLIMQGTSGSGKTYNARYLFSYLSTVAAYPQSELTSEKFFAVEVLLLSMGSASTRLNGQATRFTNFTSLQFDSLGRLVSAMVTPYLLERNRVVEPPAGEQNYNIFYQLYFSAEEQLSSDLLLNQNYSHDKPHLNFSDMNLDSAEHNFLWTLIQHSLQLLGISTEEARGIWSLLAAVYHLGHAGSTVTQKGTGKFNDPVAAQNAATALGTNLDSLQQELFYHMNTGRSSYSSSSGLNSPSASLSSSSSSSSATVPSVRAQTALKWFMIGLYEHAFHAMVLLINRALKGESSHNKANVSSINILDTPGFQNYSNASETASFDDLCHNYTQERLQMLFFDYSFTLELDRYMEEEINWAFSETPMSPLRIIDAIDKNSSQPKYSTEHPKNEVLDSKGLFWILDEESNFPGSSDQMLIDRIKINFSAISQTHARTAPALQVQGETKFLISHFQSSYPVTYTVTNWLDRVRENLSIRSVPAILSSSKRPAIATVFQGKGIAAASLNLSAQDGPLAKRYNARRKSQVTPGIPSTAKKSSVPLLTKFYLDFIMDEIRKSNQFFIRCIVPHPPEKLPLGSNANELVVPLDDFDIPFVRKQFKAGELLKATRIFKQGYPEMMLYSEFLRRFGILEQGGTRVQFSSQKEHARDLLDKFLELNKSKFKLGQSKIFFRVGTLHQLNSILEERNSSTLIGLQAVCRGHLMRLQFKELRVQELAIKCIQRNVKVFFSLKGSMWWRLMNEMKPMLEMKKTEDENLKLRERVETLGQKLEHADTELNTRRENEDMLEERIVSLTQDLTSERATSTDLQGLFSAEQLANRELLEKVFSLQRSLQVAAADTETLKEENAKLAVRSVNVEENSLTQHSSASMEEVEGLKQKVSQYRIELEETTMRKKNLESQLRSLEKEKEDFSGSLEQLRRRFNKVNSELTDSRIHGEEQASKYSELDKKQRKHESELNTAREAASSEKQAKEKLTREKLSLEVEVERVQGDYRGLEEQCNKLKKSNEDILLTSSASATHEQHELSELRRQKNTLDSQVADLEEERDELSIQSERLEQEKQRVELEIQTVRRQNLRDTESLEEEIEKTRASYNKKVKNLEQQIEEEREDKSALLRSKRDMEIELQQLRSEPSFDSVAMQKLRKKLILTKALLDDSQSELKGERDKSQKTKSVYKNTIGQFEEGQAQLQTLTRKLRQLNQEADEAKESSEEMNISVLDLQKQVADLSRGKDDLETQLEELDEDYKEERNKHNSTSQQMRLAQAEAGQLQEAISSLEEEKKRTENKLYDLEQQVKKLSESRPKTSNPASEGKLREAELRYEQECNHKKRLEKTNHRLQSQHDKLQGELELAKEHDQSKRLQGEVKKLRAALSEAEEREELALKKKREADRAVSEREQELEERSDQLRSLQIRSDKLKKTMEADFDSLDDELIDEDLSTSFEESPQVPRHFSYSIKNSVPNPHTTDTDFDLPHYSNHRHATSDTLDDDSHSARSSHSRNSSRFDLDVNLESTSRKLSTSSLRSHMLHEEEPYRGGSLSTLSKHSPNLDFQPTRQKNKKSPYESMFEDRASNSRTLHPSSNYDHPDELGRPGSLNRPSSAASSRVRSTLERAPGSFSSLPSRNKSDLQFGDKESISSIVSMSRTERSDSTSSALVPKSSDATVTKTPTMNSEVRTKLLAKRQRRKDRTFQQESGFGDGQFKSVKDKDKMNYL